MNTEEIRNSLIQANRELLLAQAELNRPHEDVVTLSACQSVRASMKHMMQLYLMAHSVDSNELMSLDELMSLCKKKNDVFSVVDLTNIECRGEGHENCDGKYCLSIENVSCCVTAANQLKSVVWKEFKIND